MSLNLKREFCSRVILSVSVCIPPNLLGLFTKRYPNPVPHVILYVLPVMLVAGLFRFVGLSFQDKSRSAKECFYASVFETIGYTIGSLAIVIFWLPINYIASLGAIFAKNSWAEIFLFSVGCFCFVCIGVCLTLVPRCMAHKTNKFIHGKKR
jgi:hypothetical protein